MLTTSNTTPLILLIMLTHCNMLACDSNQVVLCKASFRLLYMHVYHYQVALMLFLQDATTSESERHHCRMTIFNKDEQNDNASGHGRMMKKWLSTARASMGI